MFTLYKISVYIHILCAVTWIGSMIYMVAILVPAMLHKDLKPKIGLLFTVMGKRMQYLSWILFSVLIITGTFQLWYKWIGQNFSNLLNPAFWHSHFGTDFAYKLISFSIIIIISGFHDFWIGPKAAELLETQPESIKTKKFRKSARYIGQVNLILGLVILYCAVSMIRG